MTFDHWMLLPKYYDFLKRSVNLNQLALFYVKFIHVTITEERTSQITRMMEVCA